MLIQDLCDQTLGSALNGVSENDFLSILIGIFSFMKDFPVLIHYCKMIGSENRYCGNILHRRMSKKNAHDKVIQS